MAEDEEEKSSAQQPDDLDEADEDEEDGSDSEDGNTRVFYKQTELIHQPQSVLRQWLRKHGKDKYIDFTEDQMKILNECFNDLDEDGGHSIGIDELEDPLIALGLVDNR